MRRTLTLFPFPRGEISNTLDCNYCKHPPVGPYIDALVASVNVEKSSVTRTEELDLGLLSAFARIVS
jgi:hypothetical protein